MLIMITVEPIQAMTFFLFNIGNETTCFIPIPNILDCIVKARIWSPGYSWSTSAEWIS